MPTNNFPPGGDYLPEVGSLQAVCNPGYQGVNHMLAHLYGSSFVWPRSNNATPTGQLFKFDQNEFFENGQAEQGLFDGMANAAFIYVPKACEWGHPCRLHLVFHPYGYGFWSRVTADGYKEIVNNVGYLQAADANNMVVLFPEAGPISLTSWDIWGATGKEYGNFPLVLNVMLIRMAWIKCLFFL